MLIKRLTARPSVRPSVGLFLITICYTYGSDISRNVARRYRVRSDRARDFNERGARARERNDSPESRD